MCVWGGGDKKGGYAQRKMETRNLFAELFKIKGGGMGTKDTAQSNHVG